MKHYVGLDVSLKETFICVLDKNGEPVWQGKTKSHPGIICRVIHKRAPKLIKAGFEAGPLSTWHWHEFKKWICL